MLDRVCVCVVFAVSSRCVRIRLSIALTTCGYVVFWIEPSEALHCFCAVA